ncbi:MAG: tRNA lysidine(34) synthetase TilS [Bacteroidota bacterium]|nr:tRNA lysidine(34) synthetase TilS [Bacteroidota bacterium]
MAEQPLLHSFQEFIHKNHLIERGEKLIVTVSGGIDSMVLLDLLCVEKQRWKLDLAIAHFNHQLRGEESANDEAFVRSAAKKRSLVCYVECADTKQIAETEKLSIQEAARNLRYDFFKKLCSSIGFQKIATAHNADDNAETLLLNIFRGSGVHGLTGIPVYRKDQAIIRPLLFATRTDIQEYAHYRKLMYREDSSNLKSDYTRNFIRLEIIPLILNNINPNLTATLNRMSGTFNQLEDYINSLLETIRTGVIEKSSKDEIIINLERFFQHPLFIQEQLLLQIGKEFTNSEIDSGTVHTMLNISRAKTGSSGSLTKNKIIYRNRNQIVFKRFFQTTPYSYTIELNRKYQFEAFCFASSEVDKAEISVDPNIEYIDAEKIGKHLIIRSWQEGDWFIPLGMKGKKKLSDFFVDQKFPLFEKQMIPLLISDNNIVWICGKRLDERFKINSKTKKIIKLEYIPRPKEYR